MHSIDRANRNAFAGTQGVTRGGAKAHKKLDQFQLWKNSVIGTANTAMNTESGIFIPSEAADSTQDGGGKSYTLNTLWDKLRKTKTKHNNI